MNAINGRVREACIVAFSTHRMLNEGVVYFGEAMSILLVPLEKHL